MRAIRGIWGILAVILWSAAVVSGAGTSMDCRQQPNLACANGAQTSTQDVSTVHNRTGTLSPWTLDGTTADTNKITISLSADPSSSFTATIPADAASAMGKAYSCSAGQAATAFSATSGATTCGAITASSLRWDQLTNPSANLSLSMAANTTTLTWGAATGSGTNMFSILDTASNTGTGYVVSLSTASSSAAKPVRVTAGGTANGVDMTTAGLLEPIGTGGIKATTTTTGALSAALTWNESCTASPCTLAGTPRLSTTALVVQHGLVYRKVTSCGGINEYSISGAVITFCDTTPLGTGADAAFVTYEL